MAAYVPQHAARDANRFPAHMLREPRKLSLSAVTAATAYVPSTPPSDIDSHLQAANAPRKNSKTPKKDKPSEMNLEHPLLRKVGILPPSQRTPVTVFSSPSPSEPGSDDDYFYHPSEAETTTATCTTISKKLGAKVITIENPSLNDIFHSCPSSPTCPRSPMPTSGDSSRRGSLMSKVADYIKPIRPDSPYSQYSQYSQTSFGSASDDRSDDWSRRSSVMSSMSKYSTNSKRRPSTKEIDAAAIERAVIESYTSGRGARIVPLSPNLQEHRKYSSASVSRA